MALSSVLQLMDFCMLALIAGFACSNAQGPIGPIVNDFLDEVSGCGGGSCCCGGDQRDAFEIFHKFSRFTP